MDETIRKEERKSSASFTQLTEACSSSCSVETVARRSCSIRTDSWSPRRRALSSALSLLSCRFLPLRSKTSSRYLELCGHTEEEEEEKMKFNSFLFVSLQMTELQQDSKQTASHLFVQPLLLFSAPLVFSLHLLQFPPDRRSSRAQV